MPSSLISQLEALLAANRLDDAFALVDGRRKKLEESIEVDEDEVRAMLRASILCSIFADRGTTLYIPATRLSPPLPDPLLHCRDLLLQRPPRPANPHLLLSLSTRGALRSL